MDEHAPADAEILLPLPPLPPGAGAGYSPAGAIPVASPYPVFLPYAYPQPYPFVPKPRVWTVFVALILAFAIGQAFSAIVLVGLILLRKPDAFSNLEAVQSTLLEVLKDPNLILTALAANQVVLLGTAVLGGILSPVPFVKRLRVGPSTMPFYGYPLVALGGYAIGMLFTIIVQLIGIKVEGPMKELSQIFQHLSTGQLVAAVFVVGMMPAFAEEWLFRGYTQTRFRQRWGRWPAILITAALFGVMHMNLVQGTFAFFFGIYIGWIAEKCGSVRPGMLAHLTNNGLMVLVEALAKPSDGPDSTRLVAIIAGVSLLVLVLSVLYVRFAIRAAPPPVDPAKFAAPRPQPVYFVPVAAPVPAWPAYPAGGPVSPS